MFVRLYVFKTYLYNKNPCNRSIHTSRYYWYRNLLLTLSHVMSYTLMVIELRMRLGSF